MGLKIAPGMRLFLDTPAFIYFFEQHAHYGPPLNRLFDAVYREGAEVITSLITYLEITTLPARKGDQKLVTRYRSFFTNAEHVSLQPIDLLVADTAVRFRAQYSMRTPDALQWAAACVAGADAVVTNNQAWTRVADLPVYLIDDLDL